MTTAQIEKALGLRPQELSQMARIYSFARLPVFEEVDFRLSAAQPDGKIFDDAQMDAILKVVASCICGSDLWPYRGADATAEPTPMGHEYGGIGEAGGGKALGTQAAGIANAAGAAFVIGLPVDGFMGA